MLVMAVIMIYWGLDDIIILMPLIIVHFYMTRIFNYWQKRVVWKAAPIFEQFHGLHVLKENLPISYDGFHILFSISFRDTF